MVHTVVARNIDVLPGGLPLCVVRWAVVSIQGIMGLLCHDHWPETLTNFLVHDLLNVCPLFPLTEDTL
jgi:hypothetical protein